MFAKRMKHHKNESVKKKWSLWNPQHKEDLNEERDAQNRKGCSSPCSQTQGAPDSPESSSGGVALVESPDFPFCFLSIKVYNIITSQYIFKNMIWKCLHHYERERPGKIWLPGSWNKCELLGQLMVSLAAAAKSLQSCPTLCDLIDGSPPGSPIPGILQARTLEWVAISLANAWKWKVKVKSLSRLRLLATPWIATHQAPLSMGFSRQEYWSGVPSLSPGQPWSPFYFVDNVNLTVWSKLCFFHFWFAGS